MRAVLVVALLVLLALSGCSDPKSEDTNSDTGTSTSKSGTSTSSSSGSSSSSKSGTSSSSGTSTTGAPGVNKAPKANLTANVLTGTAPLAVNFTLNGTDADAGTVLKWTLAFGDSALPINGTGGFPLHAVHSYTAAGTYLAVLNVTDGKLFATSNVTMTVTAGSGGGQIDRRECSGFFGTNPAGFTFSGPISIGGCSFGTLSAPAKVVATDAVSGCEPDASPTGNSQAYGTPVPVGSEWPQGAAFRLICDVGTFALSGSIDFLPL